MRAGSQLQLIGDTLTETIAFRLLEPKSWHTHGRYLSVRIDQHWKMYVMYWVPFKRSISSDILQIVWNTFDKCAVRSRFKRKQHWAKFSFGFSGRGVIMIYWRGRGWWGPFKLCLSSPRPAAYEFGHFRVVKVLVPLNPVWVPLTWSKEKPVTWVITPLLCSTSDTWAAPSWPGW